MHIKINHDVEVLDSYMLPDDEDKDLRRLYITEAIDTYQVCLIFNLTAPWIKEYQFKRSDSADKKIEIINEIGEMVKKGIMIENELLARQNIGVSFPTKYFETK